MSSETELAETGFSSLYPKEMSGIKKEIGAAPENTICFTAMN